MKPQVVLTAAHVVSDAPGGAVAEPSELRVTAMFIQGLQLSVTRVALTSQWRGNTADALLHDVAALLVSPSAPTHLAPVLDYGQVDMTFSGAAYGFIGDDSVAGEYRQGSLVHDGAALRSSDLLLADGMSGGPMFAVLGAANTTENLLVAINRSKPEQSSAAVNVGLLLRSTVYNRLLQALGLIFTMVVVLSWRGSAQAQPPPAVPDRGAERRGSVGALSSAAPDDGTQTLTRIELERTLAATGVAFSDLCGAESAAAIPASAASALDRHCERRPRFTRAYQNLNGSDQIALAQTRPFRQASVCVSVDIEATLAAKQAASAADKLKTRKEQVKQIGILDSVTRTELEALEADAVQKQTRANNLRTFNDVCLQGVPVSGGSVILFNAGIAGLAEFMKDRAKEELIAYAVSVLGRELCRSGGPIRLGFTVGLEFAFERSCGTAFPSGTDGDLDYGAISDGRFQKAFFEEVKSLPSVATDVALEQMPSLTREARRRLSSVVRVITGELGPLIYGGRFDATDLLRRIDRGIETRLRSRGLPPKCSVAPLPEESVESGFGPECAALLALRTGAQTEKAVREGKIDELEIVRLAAIDFCSDYGATPQQGTACVGLPDDLQNDAALLRALSSGEIQGILRSRVPRTSLAVDMLALVTAFRDGVVDFEPAMRESDGPSRRSRFVAGLRSTLLVTMDFARRRLRCPTVAAAEGEEAEDTLARGQEVCRAIGIALDVAGLGIDAGLALADQDPNGVEIALKAMLAVPVIRRAFGERASRAMHFLFDLGTASNADQAKKVIERAAEPLGSYRMKYDADFVLALNGFVGPRAGAIVLLDVDKRAKRRASPDLDLVPLSGPVGLDFSWRCGRQHVGFALTAIDPLGLVTLDEADETRVDWGAVLSPGLMLRWGIQRSPIDFYFAGIAQPLRQPEAEQTAAGAEVHAYNGTFAFGGGFAVDLPLLAVASR